jgi:hypothetical protein
VLESGGDAGVARRLRAEVRDLCAAYPIYDWRLEG